MSKNYRPYRIKNPQTEGHIVRLREEQTISVIYSPEYENVQYECHSDFVEMEMIETYSTKNVHIKFKQKYNLVDWMKHGKTFLGDIILTTKKSLSILNVYLDSSDKDHITTIINPQGHKLRCNLDEVIEVVMYDYSLGHRDNWVANIVPGKEAVYEKIGYAIVENIVVNNIIRSFTVAKDTMIDITHTGQYKGIFNACPRQRSGRVVDFEGNEKKVAPREHHYWFRLKKDSYEKLKKKNIIMTEIFDAGQIIFDGSGLSTEGFLRENKYNNLNLSIIIKKNSEESNISPSNSFSPPFVQTSSRKKLYVEYGFEDKKFKKSSCEIVPAYKQVDDYDTDNWNSDCYGKGYKYYSYNGPAFKQNVTLLMKDKKDCALDADCKIIYNNNKIGMKI